MIVLCVALLFIALIVGTVLALFAIAYPIYEYRHRKSIPPDERPWDEPEPSIGTILFGAVVGTVLLTCCGFGWVRLVTNFPQWWDGSLSCFP